MKQPRTLLPLQVVLLFLIGVSSLTTTLKAGEYAHYYENPSGDWYNLAAWTPLNGSPSAIPGAEDTAYLYYGMSLPDDPTIVTSIGTLNIDTYIPWGPAPDISLLSGTLNIMDGGQWMWGGFNDYYRRSGTINQYGTFVLVDDIVDHYQNGPETVDQVQHSIQWGLTFNNYGTMQHDSLGAFNLGASACQYYNYGTHDFTNDGSITTIGHGGERTTNYGIVKKSGGLGTSYIHSEFDNQGEVVVQSGSIIIGNSLDYDGYWSHELKAGKWHVQGNSSIVIGGRGVLEVNQSHVILDGSNANLYTTQTSVYTPIEASLLTNEGTLEIYGDRTFTNAVTNTGTLKIGDDTTLTIDIINLGQMHIGNSPGLSVINGDFEQALEGTLMMELGGLIAGDEYDLLQVIGTATLDGILDLSYYEDFIASVGDSFTILDAEALIGQFSEIIFPDAQNWYVDYNEAAGDVIVGIAVPEPATLLLLAVGTIALSRRRK